MEIQSPASLKGERERKIRSILKTVSWRTIAAALTFFTALLFTKSIRTSLNATVTREILALALYYFHERTWNSIKWGKFRLEKLSIPPKERL